MAKLYMMVGLSASGKSTYAQYIAEQENAVIHSSDSLREELFGDVNENSRNDELFRELHNRMKADLMNGKNVIYDACNISYKRRKAFLNEIKKFKCEKICYFIATPYEKCLKQNQKRDRVVPEYVINRMYKNIYIPQSYEGFDKINMIWSVFDKDYYNFGVLFEGENGLKHIDQNNHHHTLTIGEHCIRTMDYVFAKTDDYILSLAALLHDIGKRETKEFRNMKGEQTTEAHYYGHHLVSAYNSMFYLKTYGYSDEDILNICNYIQWHMQPFFIQTEKAKNKFINLVGREFYDKLMILHEADVRAK